MGMLSPECRQTSLDDGDTVSVMGMLSPECRNNSLDDGDR